MCGNGPRRVRGGGGTVGPDRCSRHTKIHPPDRQWPKLFLNRRRRCARGVDRSTPDFLAEKTEQRVLIWRILEDLKPEHREILIMKYIEGRCYDDISTVLEIPRGTVMSRLYYARNAFRDRYLEETKSERD